MHYTYVCASININYEHFKCQSIFAEKDEKPLRLLTGQKLTNSKPVIKTDWSSMRPTTAGRDLQNWPENKRTKRLHDISSSQVLLETQSRSIYKYFVVGEMTVSHLILTLLLPRRNIRQFFRDVRHCLRDLIQETDYTAANCRQSEWSFQEK